MTAQCGQESFTASHLHEQQWEEEAAKEGESAKKGLSCHNTEMLRAATSASSNLVFYESQSYKPEQR